MTDGWLPMSSWHVFRKYMERIVCTVKWEESPSVQEPQYSEEDLVVWKRAPIGPRGHQSVSLSPTGTMHLLFKCGTIVSWLISDKFQSWWKIYVHRGIKTNLLHTNKGGFGEGFPERWSNRNRKILQQFMNWAAWSVRVILLQVKNIWSMMGIIIAL